MAITRSHFRIRRVYLQALGDALNRLMKLKGKQLVQVDRFTPKESKIPSKVSTTRADGRTRTAQDLRPGLRRSTNRESGRQIQSMAQAVPTSWAPGAV